MLTIIIIFLVLLFLSGFFSSAELSMMSLSGFQVRRLVKEKKRHAKTLQKLKQNPHKLLETILIGNNLVNIAAASIATALSIQLFGSMGIGIATGITTFLVLLFGEIIPKSVAVNHRKRLSLVFSPILYGLQWILTPVVTVIDAIASVFIKLFGEAERERITEEEVRDLVAASEQDGYIKKREREMIQGVLDLDDTNVGEIMTPRLDVFCLEMHQLIDQVVDSILDTGYTRIPVYDKRMDRIKGVVLVKDLLRALHDNKRDAQLRDVMQEVLVVPESKKIDRVLRDFQKRKSPFAIVVDEHGLFIGIITIEDVLEELVGEIYDENDRTLKAGVRKVSKTAYLVPGKTSIEELNEEYRFDLPKSDDYDTMGGLLIERFGHIPKIGDEVRVGVWRCIVDKMAHNRVVTVRIERQKPKK